MGRKVEDQKNFVTKNETVEDKEKVEKNQVEKIVQLEKELKAAQLQLATKEETTRLAEKIRVLEEHMELKNIIIHDKERTIQILSSPAS